MLSWSRHVIGTSSLSVQMLAKTHILLLSLALLAACGTEPPGAWSAGDAEETAPRGVGAMWRTPVKETADTGVSDVRVPSADVGDVAREVGDDARSVDVSPSGQEDCNNGMDDNGDGLLDCEDPICATGPLCAGADCPGALELKCEGDGYADGASDQLYVLPLATLNCTARTPGVGEWIPIRWEVAEAPPGSTSALVPSGEREASFFVDLAGRFVLRATVEEGGCSYSDTVTQVSRPDEDIHIQLVWHTPADPDETDVGLLPGTNFSSGTDLDLHLLHPHGCWGGSVWDCHFRTPTPNWGEPARSDDDPSMDIDDTDGAGPENINLDNPESGARYRVGVHYYNDHGYGLSYATVRVYIFGALAFESTDKELGDDEWWVVGAIDWPTGQVSRIDDVFQDVPPCGI